MANEHPKLLKTIDSERYLSDFRELGSKFYALMQNVRSTDDFTQFLNEVKSQYPDATHHCSAWRILYESISEFSQDDGEPSGTAGLPILNQLRSFELINVAIIVVRYFGGTKLGKAGLIEAYGSAARNVIETAKHIEVQQAVSISIHLNYDTKKVVDGILKKHHITVHQGEYLEKIVYHIFVPEPNANDFLNDLQHIEYLGVTFEVMGKALVEV